MEQKRQALKEGCRIRWFDGLPGGPEKGQEEGQVAEGKLTWPGGAPMVILKVPWPPGLLPGHFLDPHAVHQTTLSYSLDKVVVAFLRHFG